MRLLFNYLFIFAHETMKNWKICNQKTGFSWSTLNMVWSTKVKSRNWHCGMVRAIVFYLVYTFLRMVKLNFLDKTNFHFETCSLSFNAKSNKLNISSWKLRSKTRHPLLFSANIIKKTFSSTWKFPTGPIKYIFNIFHFHHRHFSEHYSRKVPVRQSIYLNPQTCSFPFILCQCWSDHRVRAVLVRSCAPSILWTTFFKIYSSLQAMFLRHSFFFSYLPYLGRFPEGNSRDKSCVTIAEEFATSFAVNSQCEKSIIKKRKKWRKVAKSTPVIPQDEFLNNLQSHVWFGEGRYSPHEGPEDDKCFTTSFSHRRYRRRRHRLPT